MFGAKMQITGGLEKWFSGLARGRSKKVRKPLRKGGGAAERPEPVTRGEKALYEAMGWATDDDE